VCRQPDTIHLQSVGGQSKYTLLSVSELLSCVYAAPGIAWASGSVRWAEHVAGNAAVLFESHPLCISAGLPNILAEVFRRFPQSIHSLSSLVLQLK
jgi:hypothetical protein